MNKLDSTKRFELISIIGLGYIGLPTAAVIAAAGYHVVGIDLDEIVVSKINQGQIHIVESKLGDIVKNVVASGHLRASVTVESADAFLIAVPTPITSGKKADMRYVESAVAAIALVLKRGDLIILESTSPVGATKKIVDILKTLRPDLRFPDSENHDNTAEIDINVAYCPERVLPGKIVEELKSNDRAIGGMTKACTARAIQLYQLFVEGELFATDTRSAELCKLAENAFRDVNIAYANELANICERMGMDVWEVITLANRHPRVNILRPGPGVGGHCIAVDPWFIAETAPDDTPLIQAAREINDRRPYQVYDQVKRLADKIIGSSNNSNGKLIISCYGLAFKPNIDDLRESPALQIVKALSINFPNKVMVVEPNINSLPNNLVNVGLVDTSQAFKNAGIHVFLVKHDEFKLLSKPDGHVIDACGLWNS